MSLSTVTFQGDSSIAHSFQLQREPRSILVARFEGVYRVGCKGAPDGRLIQGLTGAALIIWRPSGLILDLRQLSYVWGDEMEEVLGMRGEIKIPFAVVGSELCLPAIGTLIKQFSGFKELKTATDAENVFEGIEEAFDYVGRKIDSTPWFQITP